jgi:hypothetical protein
VSAARAKASRTRIGEALADGRKRGATIDPIEGKHDVRSKNRSAPSCVANSPQRPASLEHYHRVTGSVIQSVSRSGFAARRCRHCVPCSRVWGKDHLQASVAHPQCKIDVFDVREEIIIEKPHCPNRLPRNRHQRAHGPTRVNYLLVSRTVGAPITAGTP